MKPPSVLQPSLTTGVCQQMVLVKEAAVQKLWARRVRLEQQLVEIDRQLGIAERELSDMHEKYERVKETGEVDDNLLPDGSHDAKREVARKSAAERTTHRSRDEADLLDLQHRLKGSNWRVKNHPRRRNGELAVVLVNARRSRTLQELRDEAAPRAARAAAIYADRYRSGSNGLTPQELTQVPLNSGREAQRSEPDDVEDHVKQQE